MSKNIWSPVPILKHGFVYKSEIYICWYRLKCKKILCIICVKNMNCNFTVLSVMCHNINFQIDHVYQCLMMAVIQVSFISRYNCGEDLLILSQVIQDVFCLHIIKMELGATLSKMFSKNIKSICTEMDDTNHIEMTKVNTWQYVPMRVLQELVCWNMRWEKSKLN